jgi:hypothetical protein
MKSLGGKRVGCRLLPGLILLIVASGVAIADDLVMQIGSKSNPNAHLFSYDQKFRESTYLENYQMNVSISKEFTEATRLSTAMKLRAEKNVTEIVINADFIGMARISYLVLDPETVDKHGELSHINHMFVGNFTLDEHMRVVRDYILDNWGLGPV